MKRAPGTQENILYITVGTCLYAGESIYEMFDVANITVASRIEYPYFDARMEEIVQHLLRLKQTSRSKYGRRPLNQYGNR